MKRWRFLLGFALVLGILMSWSSVLAKLSPQPPLWQVYQQSFRSAKYVDLTHTITPTIPVWSGFGAAKFSATTNPKTNQAYTYSIAICPPDWKFGVAVGQVPEAPLSKAPHPLHWGERLGVRVR